MTIENAEQSEAAKGTSAERSNPVLLCGLVLALGSLAVQWGGVQDDSQQNLPPAPALALPTSTDCTVDSSRAEMRASELRTRAYARWERAAFAPEVALRAVDDAQQASACFTLAGTADRAREADELADHVRLQSERDYERLQLKLRVALKRDDTATALAAIAGLRGLLGDERGPYGRWLLATEQGLRAAGGAL